MPTNHILLVMSFVSELRDLAMAQMWIDKARTVQPENNHLQMMLDRKQAILAAREDKIHDQMFEISRSN